MNAFEIDLPARGGAVHALRFGPADRTPDLVFLHANGFNARTYRALLEPLADDWCALAFDQRGHGLSRLPADGEGRWSWFDLRDDLLAVLDALRIERAVLAGHSMGGTVSVLASAAEPARARSLLLLDPVIIPARRTASPPSRLGRDDAAPARALRHSGAGDGELSRPRRLRRLA